MHYGGRYQESFVPTMFQQPTTWKCYLELLRVGFLSFDARRILRASYNETKTRLSGYVRLKNVSGRASYNGTLINGGLPNLCKHLIELEDLIVEFVACPAKQELLLNSAKNQPEYYGISTVRIRHTILTIGCYVDGSMKEKHGSPTACNRRVASFHTSSPSLFISFLRRRVQSSLHPLALFRSKIQIQSSALQVAL